MDAESDWLLKTFIVLADSGVETPVTLTIGGLLMSGTIVSETTYLEATEAQLKQSLKNSGAALLTLEKLLAKAGESISDTKLDSGFIHLRGAKVLAVKDGPSTGVLWRGRLRDIAGFSLDAA